MRKTLYGVVLSGVLTEDGYDGGGRVVVGAGNDCHFEGWVEARRVTLAFPFLPPRVWTLQKPLIPGLAVVSAVAVQGSNPSSPGGDHRTQDSRELFVRSTNVANQGREGARKHYRKRERLGGPFEEKLIVDGRHRYSLNLLPAHSLK